MPCDALHSQPACFAAFEPGPTADALDATRVSGATTYEPSGAFLVTTVAVEADLDVAEWIQASLSPRIQLIDREVLFPEDTDREDVRRQNAALMQVSQLDATIAALRNLGYDVDESFDGAEIVQLTSPTAIEDDALQVGDIIVAVDGQAVADNTEVGEVIGSHAPGDVVEITARRGSETVTASVELIENPQGADESRGYLGVFLVSHLELPVEVDIDAGAIGGPSAGLVFALAIVDLLEPEDLTGGAVVAGTGTIDRDGNVGPIGGIAQKIIGATSPRGDQAPATVFLVPRGNFEAAQKAAVDREVLLVPVDTLDEALSALGTLRAGGTPADAYALGAP